MVVEPAPVIESVWDYPRPPRLEPVAAPVSVVFGGAEIARSTRALRVLETSHPPTYYIPPGDILPGALVPAPGASLCEWKGRACYWSVEAGGRRAERAAWSYPEPTEAYAALRDHVAFYPGRMDRCCVGAMEASAQPGDFYGGWVTPNLRGPFKGGPSTAGW
jgi:uncharacterized protein (DUF427 family)